MAEEIVPIVAIFDSKVQLFKYRIAGEDISELNNLYLILFESLNLSNN